MSSPGQPMPPGNGGPPPQLIALAVQLLQIELQRAQILGAAAQMVQQMGSQGAPADAAPGPVPSPAGPPRPNGPVPVPNGPRGAVSPIGMRPTQ